MNIKYTNLIKQHIHIFQIKTNIIIITSHCENADKETNASSSQHDLLLGIVSSLLFLGSPYSDRKDHNIEDDDGNNTPYVDHLDSIFL